MGKLLPFVKRLELPPVPGPPTSGILDQSILFPEVNEMEQREDEHGTESEG